MPSEKLADFKHKFSKRVQSIAVSAIKQMPLEARSVPQAVSLGQGIPSLRTPAYIRRQIINLLEGDQNIGKYSLQPGLPELKQAVANLISIQAKRVVDAESEVFISAGGMEALFTAMVSIIEEGDEVILFDPSYASHIEQVTFAGGRPVFVPLVEESGWCLDQEKMRDAVTPRTKAIVVCNPGNPTGNVFSKLELRCIADFAQQHNLYIIADETYDFLVYDDNLFVSMAAFAELQKQVIVCGSFSKRFAMTGWRVGYMHAHRAIIDQALKVHDATVICAPTIAQYAALAALANPDDPEVLEIKQTLANRRKLVCSRLDALPDLFSYTRPAGAYYVLPKYSLAGSRLENSQAFLNSTAFAKRLLHEARVITIPGSAFGPAGEGHIRLSFGGTEAEINEAFDRIEAWSASL